MLSVSIGILGFGESSILRAIVFLMTVPLLVFIYHITLHPLAGFPGPISWSISRIPWHVSLHRGRLHLDLHRLHQKYGSVVRVAPNELSYVNADAYRDIYTTRPGHKLIPRNAIWFPGPKDQKGEKIIIIGHNEAGHARLRRGFAAAFTEVGVREMSHAVVRHVDLMIKQLDSVLDRAKSNSRDGATIDLVEWLSFTIFDIVGELSLGVGFGSIEAEKAHPWVAINFQLGRGVAMMRSLSSVRPLDRVVAAMMPKAAQEKIVYYEKVTTESVARRLSEGRGKADFMAAVETYNEECEAKGQHERMVTRRDLNHNMGVMTFAGSDTTSTGLSSIFRYLLQNGMVMEKLVSEIDDGFKNHKDITPDECGKLKYLDAVIQEGLRLGPPLCINVPRQIPTGGEEICGQHLPGGTLVSAANYAAFRSAQNFEEPERFLPERFLVGEKESRDNRQAFQPFGLGRHTCLGYRLAWLMMRVVTVQLLYTFDLKLVGNVGDFGQQRTYIFWDKQPLYVRLSRRIARVK